MKCIPRNLDIGDLRSGQFATSPLSVNGKKVEKALILDENHSKHYAIELQVLVDLTLYINRKIAISNTCSYSRSHFRAQFMNGHQQFFRYKNLIETSYSNENVIYVFRSTIWIDWYATSPFFDQVMTLI